MGARNRYDLEERTYQFARRTTRFTQQVHRTAENVEMIKQLVRSAGSVGANYIEADEAVSRKDFIYRIKICKKEAKESRYWLKLPHLQSDQLQKERNALIQESTEFVKIFASIVRRSQ